MENSLVVKYRKYIKARINTTRIMCLLMTIVSLALIAFAYFGFGDGMWNCVSILYLSGFTFTMNSQLQDLMKAKKWAVANRVAAAVLYLATVAVLVLIILKATGTIML